MTMITPSYLGETIEYSSLHACRSTLEDPTAKRLAQTETDAATPSSPAAAIPTPASKSDYPNSELVSKEAG